MKYMPLSRLFAPRLSPTGVAWIRVRVRVRVRLGVQAVPDWRRLG